MIKTLQIKKGPSVLGGTEVLSVCSIRKAEKICQRQKTEGGKVCESRGRHWNGVAISQGEQVRREPCFLSSVLQRKLSSVYPHDLSLRAVTADFCLQNCKK